MRRTLWQHLGKIRELDCWHRISEGFLQVLMADTGDVNKVNQRKLDIPGRGNRVACR